jgi:hypothetical protein
VSVHRLVGVYAADGTTLGEVRYWIGARLGRAHCALCDITHGTFRERQGWRECRDGLPVPFEAVHRDELTPELAEVVDALPCVLAEDEGGAVVVLLGPDDLADCRGEPELLAAALQRALVDR